MDTIEEQECWSQLTKSVDNICTFENPTDDMITFAVIKGFCDFSKLKIKINEVLRKKLMFFIESKDIGENMSKMCPDRIEKFTDFYDKSAIIKKIREFLDKHELEQDLMMKKLICINMFNYLTHKDNIHFVHDYCEFKNFLIRQLDDLEKNGHFLIWEDRKSVV